MKYPSPQYWPPILRFVFKSLTICFAGLLIWQSLEPSNAAGSILHIDKLLHLIVYGALAGLMRLGWWKYGSWLVLASCSALGFGLEILQGLFAIGRTASIFDGFANVAGILLALFILGQIWPNQNIPRKNPPS